MGCGGWLDQLELIALVDEQEEQDEEARADAVVLAAGDEREDDPDRVSELAPNAAIVGVVAVQDEPGRTIDSSSQGIEHMCVHLIPQLYT